MDPIVFDVRACRPWLRGLAAALQALAALNLLELAARAALDLAAPADVQRLPLPLLVQRLFFFSALPALLELVLWRSAAATLAVGADRATLVRRGARVEVPLQAVAALRPFRVPLPWPGFSLRLASGRALDDELSLRDPAPLAALLSDRARAPAASDPSWADAAAHRRTRLLRHPALKFVLVPAVVAFIVFRLQQRIAFGGLFGELDAFGLARWLNTLTGVTLLVLGHFLLLAAGLRAVVELVMQPALRLLPRGACGLRIALDCTAAAVYYLGTAAVLFLRLG